MHKKNKYQCLAGLLAACLMMSVLPSGTTLIYADGADMDATVQTTAMRAVYDELYREEKLWAGNLKNSFQNPPEIDDLYYTDFTMDTTADDNKGKEAVDEKNRKINISQYAKEHNYTYVSKDNDPGGFTYRKAYGIKGPEPFEGANENAYKWIKKMDGGVNVRFMGGTNQTDLTSNVQEICAMAVIAQEQQDNGHEKKSEDQVVFGDDAWNSDNGFVKLVHDFVTTVRMIVNKIVDTVTGAADKVMSTAMNYKWFQNWYKAHIQYKESQAYMAYAKPLFDQSHREGYNLQVSLLPTKWTSHTVYSSYTTTTGYTTGEVSMIKPGSTVNTTLSESTYRQLENNAVTAGRTLNMQLVSDYLDGKARTANLDQSARTSLLASYSKDQILAMYKKGSSQVAKLDQTLSQHPDYSHVGKAIKYSEDDLNMAARMVAHEAGSSSSKSFNRNGSVAVAQCMRNWVLHAPGNGRSTSIQTNINRSCVPWCSPGSWNPNSPVDPVIKDLVRNVFNGIEYVNDNEYMAFWKSNGAGIPYKHCVDDSAPVSPGNGIALESYDYGFSRQSFYHDGYAKHTDAKRLGANVAGDITGIVLSPNADGTVDTRKTSDTSSDAETAEETPSTGRTTNVASCPGDDDDSSEITDYEKYGLDPENFESYGFGCMTYDKFFFKDPDSTDMYYDPAEKSVENAKRRTEVASVAYVVYAKDHDGTTSKDTKLTFPESEAPDIKSLAVNNNGGQAVSEEDQQYVTLSDGSRFLPDANGHLIRISAEGKPVQAPETNDPSVHLSGRYHYIQDGTYTYDADGDGTEDSFNCFIIDPDTKQEYLAVLTGKGPVYALYHEADPSQMDTGSEKTPQNDANSQPKVSPEITDEDDPVDETLREEYDHRFVCVAPKGVQEKFLPAYENNTDCWESSETGEEERIRCNPEDFTSNGTMKEQIGSYADHILLDPNGGDYYYWPVTEGKGESWYIWASADGPEWIPHYNKKHQEDGGHWEATVRKIEFHHHCKGGHRGYYCGGHLLIDSTGIIYHMTDAEKNAQANTTNPRSYAEKMIQTAKDQPYIINPDYYPSYKNKGKTFAETIVDRFSENAVDKDGLSANADDLFDIDLALQHQKGGISDDFVGWNAANIEHASALMEDDWDQLYGIKVEKSLGDFTPEQNTADGTVSDISGKTVNADFSKDDLYDFTALRNNLISSNSGKFAKYIQDKTKVISINDNKGNTKQYFYELQGGSPAWSNCKTPNNMNAEGCFIFAAAAAASNLSGRCYLAADALAAAGGGDWRFDESKNAFSISGDPGRHSAGMRVGGSLQKLQDILDDATGGEYTATDYVHFGSFDSGCMQKIMNGATALIYASSAAGSSHSFRTGSAHWTYIAGWSVDSDGDPCITLLCNDDRSNTFKMKDIGKLEHVYIIEKK